MQKKIFEDRNKWLKNRASYIGGSDLATILGLSEYTTPYQLWELRTGRQAPFENNKHTLAGRFLEDGVAKYWEFETGNKLIKSSSRVTVYNHPDYGFLGGSPDRRFFLKGSQKFSDRGILEVKTTMKSISHEDIPFGWYIQPNFYAGLLKYDFFVIVWFDFFTKELKWDMYPFDKEMYDMSVKGGVDFWTNNILKDIPPTAINGDDISLKYPNSIKDKSVIADDKILDIYSNAIEIKRQNGILNKQYDKIQNEIKLVMKDAEYLLSPDLNVLFTFRDTKRGRMLKIKEI